MAMEYRYWITEEEVEKIGYVVELLGRLQDAIRSECGSHKYFEDVCLAIPNWSTWLFRTYCAKMLINSSLTSFVGIKYEKVNDKYTKFTGRDSRRLQTDN
jgi:hypothetical protein